MVSTVRRALDCAQAGFVFFFLFLLGCMFALGQDKTQTQPQTAQAANAEIAELAAATAHPRTGDIPIGAGDILHIDVFEVPDLSQDVRVGETGLISLPLIPDRIPVAGCTPYQLSGNLDKLLQANGLVMHPQVSVIIKEQNSGPISIAGAVRHPVVLHEVRPTTLIEALAEADGVSDDAGDNILITRQKEPALVCGQEDPPPDPTADPETFHIKVSELLEKGNPAFNVPVYAGDVITVPRAGIIYVVGSVGQPGGYALNDPGATFDVMKMIALAHGLAPYAKTNDSVVLRKDPTTGQTKEIPVKLKRILDRKDPDIRLYAGDILYVPGSGAKRALATASGAAIGIGTGLAIYRIP
jgi:polysaccharide biosynthesis/export protein